MSYEVFPKSCRNHASHAPIKTCKYCFDYHLKLDDTSQSLTPEERLLKIIFGQYRDRFVLVKKKNHLTFKRKSV